MSEETITKGTLCCFSYINATKSNDRRNAIVDDSFVPMYDFEISVYNLSYDGKYSHSKNRLSIPNAKFLYIKRIQKEPDPIMDSNSSYSWLHDNHLDHGHIVLFEQNLIFISDASMHYMDICIVPVV